MKNLTIIIFCAALFLGVILTALTNMGGNSEPLKAAVEDYLSAFARGKAEVGTLHNMQFFPTTKLHISDVRVMREKETDPVLTLKEAQAAMSAWDVFLQSGKVKVVNIRELYARAGVLLQKEIYIKRMGIVDEKLDEAPYLLAEGKYGGRPVSLRIDMQRLGAEDSPSYKTGDDMHIALTSAPLKLQLTLDKSSGRKIHIKDLQASLQGVDQDLNLKADLTAQASASMENIYVEGTLSAQDSTSIQPDLKIALGADPIKITGSITAEKASIETLSALVRLVQEVDSLISEASPANQLSFDGAEVDVTLDIKDLMQGDKSIGRIKGPITMKDKTLTVGPFHGALKNSKLDGQMRLSSPHGKKDSLTGDISLILGKGKAELTALNLWGGGLVNAIMPDLELKDKMSEIQCGIANIAIEKGQADIKTLFLDTSRVTLKGKGSYDVINDKLDIVLKPKAKEMAIGSVASAVDISGPIADPSITPNLLDLGATLGGLVLGIVNPAFFAFSMTDLGLTDDHPCAEFIKESK